MCPRTKIAEQHSLGIDPFHVRSLSGSALGKDKAWRGLCSEAEKFRFPQCCSQAWHLQQPRGALSLAVEEPPRATLHPTPWGVFRYLIELAQGNPKIGELSPSTSLGC